MYIYDLGHKYGIFPHKINNFVAFRSGMSLQILILFLAGALCYRSVEFGFFIFLFSLSCISAVLYS